MVYKKGRRFRCRSVQEIYADIDEAFDRYGPSVQSIFFPAGNTIAMPTKDLSAICRYSKIKFPEVQRMTVYGSSPYIVQKGLLDMKLLQRAGLSRIHVGLESGDDTTLKRVKKGTSATEQIQAGQIVKQAGIQLSEYVILGLGGTDRSTKHALKTAEVVNEIEPDFVRLRTLVPKINTLLLHQINKGRFHLLSPHQVLLETRLLIENISVATVLTSDHYTNYLNLSGKLPEDKDRLLEAVNQALTWGPSRFRPNFIGTQ
jgi:radical SAM superfamily enzyme YgiQ (UPF0313 family)